MHVHGMYNYHYVIISFHIYPLGDTDRAQAWYASATFSLDAMRSRMVGT